MSKGTVKPDATAHQKGVAQGNSTGNYEKMSGHFADGRSSAERSTGTDAKGREPIDPRMPNLSPA
jgi:hypothetical protein